MASPSASMSNPGEIATLTWTIEDFAQVNEVTSPLFSSSNSSNCFQLKLSFCTEDESQIVLSYFWPTEEALFYYQYSILDANGEEHHIREHIWDYNKFLKYQFDLTVYISRSECEKLLVNGSLKIYCEVNLYNSDSTRIESFSNLSKNYETLLKSGKFSDFIIQIGDKQFRVHKIVLATRSSVFAAMFEDDESKEVKEGLVAIEDVEVDVFELMIRYIYTGKVDELGEHAAGLLVAAKKYKLDGLKSICLERRLQSLISSLTVKSVCGVLLRYGKHNVEPLKSKCIEFIVKHAHEVMKTEGWKKLKSKRIDLVAELCEKLANKVDDD